MSKPNERLEIRANCITSNNLIQSRLYHGAESYFSLLQSVDVMVFMISTETSYDSAR